jgi:phenylacetate-CoA ligase
VWYLQRKRLDAAPDATMSYELLFKHLLFPAYEGLVKRRATATHVAECEKNQWLPAADLQRLQLSRLNALLAHGWAHVPFLQTYWADHGVKPGNLGHVAELQAYPTITKALITEHYQQMIALPWKGRTLSKATGGSTGVPFRFEYTMDSYARRVAAMWRGYGWAGAGLGARTAFLWGTGEKETGWRKLKVKLYHDAFTRRFFDVAKLTEANIDASIDAMIQYQPHAVVGYVAPTALVARRMNATGRRMSGLRGVITAAEALYDAERADIEQAFGCKAFNTYGSREVMLMAAECDRHEGLHVTADQLVLETVDAQGQAVPAGQSGNVAVTDLFNLGMPLVRYLNGDRATYASQATCSCGRSLPLLSSVDGRVLDMIHTPDGRLLPGEIFVAMIYNWPAIFKFQVVQTAKDVLQFRLVMNRPWHEGERDAFIARIRQDTGTLMRIELAEVADIPPNATGKRRITVSLANAHTVAPLP